MTSSRENKHWSYITGRRGLNRVRAFVDRPGDPIEIEWFPGGRRRRRVLRSPSGIPIFDKDLARQMADRIAESILRESEDATLEELLGFDTHRLKELLDRIHSQADWTQEQAVVQNRMRAFWLESLGDIVLTRINARMVEDVVKRAARKRGWAPSTQALYLRYIVDAFSFAERELGWITERYNLSAASLRSEDPGGMPAEFTRQVLEEYDASAASRSRSRRWRAGG